RLGGRRHPPRRRRCSRERFRLRTESAPACTPRRRSGRSWESSGSQRSPSPRRRLRAPRALCRSRACSMPPRAPELRRLLLSSAEATSRLLSVVKCGTTSWTKGRTAKWTMWSSRSLVAGCHPCKRPEGDEMSVMLLHQKVKDGSVDQAEKAARDLFAALDRVRPEGIRYASTRVADSSTFVAVLELTDGGDDPRLGIPE